MTKSHKTQDKLNVFICSAKDDLAKATEIYFKLIQETWISPWLETENIAPGQDWEKEIGKEMLSAHAIIICLSKKAVAKQSHFQKEIKDALDIAKEMPQGEIFIIPLVLNDCKIPIELRHIHQLDYTDPERDYEKLCLSLNKRADSVKIKKTQPTQKTEKEPIQDPFDGMPKKLALLTLDEDIKEFDSYRNNNICFVLSKLLDVDEKHIVIKDFFDGSVKVVLELPEAKYAHLEYLWRNRDKNLLRLFKIKSFSSLEQELRESKEKLGANQEVELFPEIPIENGMFVGRTAELNMFWRMLKGKKEKKHILLLLGPGGIGKTKLINRMLAVAKGADILAPVSAIDFFSMDNWHIDGIQEKVVHLIEELTGQRKNAGPFAGWMKGKIDSNEVFHKCLKAFCAAHPLVLAFDAFENLDKVATDWLFKDEPDGLQVPGLICVIAGRNNLDKAPLETYRNLPTVNIREIQGLTFEETLDFYQKIGDEYPDIIGGDLLLDLGLSPSKPIEKGLKRIWYMTEGHPLRLEMAFRWQKNILDPHRLANITPEQYEADLMEYVREWGLRGELPVGRMLLVQQPLFEILLCMAYVVRRFDRMFLQFFLDKKIIHFSDGSISTEDVLEYLQQYFFVKTRGPTADGLDVVQLHDEMARLFRDYVWPYFNPSADQRDRIYRALIEYYDGLIAQSGQISGEFAETLQIEQLYYMLQLDPIGIGLQRWLELVELRNTNINKFLPGEIKSYIEDYDVNTRQLIRRKLREIERSNAQSRF